MQPDPWRLFKWISRGRDGWIHGLAGGRKEGAGVGKGASGQV